MRIRSLQLSLVMALAAALAAAPADAQGKGKGKDKDKQRERTEQVRFRDDDRRDRDDDDDRWDDDDVRLERRRQVPPGWCKGKGNPHNTRENCGYDRRDDDRRRDDRRYDDRRRDDRYDTRSGSYEQAHQAFHRDHDRICRERASQRPFDPRWQLQVRGECKAEHDRWHANTGSRH
ncbi:MAG TPA: hypothetical protein VGV85_05925 [Longimicrobiaceae bacterium]|nr:hypothetical protein [Longimicrobiaceae bacterium]